MFTFNQLAGALEQISTYQSRNQISEAIAEIFRRLDGSVAQQVAYLLLGMLGPSYDPGRSNFNLAEKQLQKFLTDFVQSNFGDDMVLDFVVSVTKQGDLGQALFILLENCQFSPREQELSLPDCFTRLQELAEVSGSGAVEEKKRLFIDLLKNLNPLGQKYLIKILAGQLRLGFSVSSLLDAFSYLYSGDKKLKPLLEQNYNVSADVGQLILDLKTSGVESLENPVPKLGVPVCPATAERVKNLDELLQRQQDFVVQPKLDGLRIQIHKTGRRVTLFSRNLLNVSEMFPEVVENVSALDTPDFIADGELLGYDRETGKDVAFQQTSKRRRKHDVLENASEFPVRVYLFDLLFWDRDSCLQKPLEDRRIILEDNFGELENPAIKIIDEVKFNCTDDEELILQVKEEVLRYFLDLKEKGYEGILVKKSGGGYQAGKRGFNWIKIKDLEEHKLHDTIDAVIIGMFFGKGRRAELGMGAFLVALYNPRVEMFQTLAKVGSGLTDDEAIELSGELRSLQVEHKPINYESHSTLEPDVWVEAKIVVELQADDVTISKVHSAAFGEIQSGVGLALRFPRVVAIRRDKSFTDATTTIELVRFVKARYGW